MQQGTVSSADRLSQGVIAWPQVRRIPEKNRYFAGFLGFASDFAPDQPSDSGELESVARMEHQTPSGFPGNFRKKCWGPSRFLFGFRKHGEPKSL